MIPGVPLGELAWLAAVIVAGGVLAGFSPACSVSAAARSSCGAVRGVPRDRRA